MSFTNGVKLVGYNVEPDAVRAGEQDRELRLTLFWETAGASEPASKKLAISADAPRGDFMMFSHRSAATASGRPAMIPLEVTCCYPARLVGGTDSSRGCAHLGSSARYASRKSAFRDRAIPFVRQSDPLQRIPVVNDQGQPVADQVEVGAMTIGDQPPAADLSGLPILASSSIIALSSTGWRASAMLPTHAEYWSTWVGRRWTVRRQTIRPSFT